MCADDTAHSSILEENLVRRYVLHPQVGLNLRRVDQQSGAEDGDAHTSRPERLHRLPGSRQVRILTEQSLYARPGQTFPQRRVQPQPFLVRDTPGQPVAEKRL